MRSDLSLVIDVGNTSTKMVCFDGKEKVVEGVRVKDIFCDEASAFVSKYSFRDGIYCSTVAIDDAFRGRIESFGVPMLHFQPGVTPIPIKNLSGPFFTIS